MNTLNVIINKTGRIPNYSFTMIERIRNYLKNKQIINYKPGLIEEPTLKLNDVSSAWKGNELIIKDIIRKK